MALAAPASTSAEVPAAEIAAAVRGAALVLDGVTAAYMRPDGQRFLITGPTWTPELSEKVAKLVVTLRRSYAPAGPWLDGSFLEDAEVPPGWRCVYACEPTQS